MGKNSLIRNEILLIIYYFIFYLPFLFQIGKFLNSTFITVTFLLSFYLIIPVLIWLKFVFENKKPDYIRLLILSVFLSLPFAHTYRMGFFFMAHNDFSVELAIKALPFALLIAIAIGLLSTCIKYVHIYLSKNNHF